ncbi:MAG: hypothetical protein WCB27_15040 [Thermoguttaceae bacterium]
MNKLAVFVEGLTEVLFMDKLIEEIAGEHNVLIEHRAIRGGTTTKLTTRLIKAARPNTGQKYFVLIYDCGADNSVKTRIRYEHQNLTNHGYSRIIGLHDVAPTFTRDEIPKLEASLPKYIKTSLIPVTFILAIMEIEGWFLAETTHYGRIDPAITVAAIKETLKFDPEHDDMEQRSAPADDLDNCYKIGGKRYTKRKGRLQRTADALDYAPIYIKFPEKFRYVGKMIGCIEAFLT